VEAGALPPHPRFRRPLGFPRVAPHDRCGKTCLSMGTGSAFKKKRVAETLLKQSLTPSQMLHAMPKHEKNK
jgi:hypothetical protein